MIIGILFLMTIVAISFLIADLIPVASPKVELSDEDRNALMARYQKIINQER